MADLGKPEWLTADTTRKVMGALEAARAGSARFVGGCVRNALMGRAVDDIDIATQLTPQEVIAALEATGIRAIPTGLEHGTITAVCDSIPFEITTLRRDVETDGRRAVVAFTEDWTEDAMRRDFRLNALYAEPDGTLHDPTGGGLYDAASGQVIFIGNADERLREDYLRILRFFRFNAWYGAGIDAEGLAACERQKDGLSQIAAERIWKELKKLLAAPEPAEAVQAMADSGVLKATLPWAVGTDRLGDVVSRSGEAMHRFMSLLPKDVETVSLTASKLRLSNAERDQLEGWASEPALAAGQGADAWRKLIYTLGRAAAIDLAVMSDAVTADERAEAIRVADTWQPTRFPLGGDDAHAVGLKGPAVGEALRTIEAEWIESDFALDRDALRARLKTHA